MLFRSYVPPTPRIPDPPTVIPPDDLKPIPLEGGAEVAEQMLKRNCALLLEHAGFEGNWKISHLDRRYYSS